MQSYLFSADRQNIFDSFLPFHSPKFNIFYNFAP